MCPPRPYELVNAPTGKIPVTYSLPRRLFSFSFAALLVAGLLAVLPAVTRTAPASAAQIPFQCVDTLYATLGSNVYRIDLPSGAMVKEDAFAYDATSLNALAITAKGRAGYAMGPAVASGSTNQAPLFQVGTKAPIKTVTGLSASGNMVAGAMNPKTGRYWIGHTSGSNLVVYEIDPSASGATISPLAKVTIPMGMAANGNDMAFDSRGNLYVVVSHGTNGGNKMLRVTAADLANTTTAPTVQVTGLATGSFPGIAFGSDGHIYVQGGSTLSKLLPTTGARVADGDIATTTGSGSAAANTDLASCATPGVMDSVMKDVTARKRPTDQFTVSLTGAGMTTPLTGTTTGTDIGLQDQVAEIAGPSLVLPNKEYTFSETAVGTGNSLSDYLSTYECINTDTSAVITSGTGTSGKLMIPAADADGVNTNVTCTFTNTPTAPSIALTKTATGSATQAGDTISYGYTVRNTGNTGLTNVAISDPQLTGRTITCAATSLAVGASTTCTVSAAYVVTQGDVNAGTAGGTATVTAKLGTADVTATGSSATPIARTARLKIEKTATGAPTRAGGTITYAFTVTNTGNTTISGVMVNDPLLGANAVTCSTTTLAPAASTTCTAPAYVVTQGDVDAGTVANSATVSGTPPSGVALTTDAASSGSTVTPLTRTSQLTLVKTAAGAPAKAGDTIAYSFRVTNTGTTTVTGVAVSDPRLGAGAVTCPTTTLAPGASVTCTAPAYVVTQGDIDAGTVTNAATATGTGPGGTSVPASSGSAASTVTPITATAGLSATAVATGTPTTAGDEITYTLTVRNTGDVTVRGLGTGDTLDRTYTCAATTLAPGATTTCTTTYAVTQSDVDAGRVTNLPRATVTDATGTTLSAGPTNSLVTTIVPAPQLTTTLAQSAASVARAGDPVTYTATVRNTGTVTVTNLALSDTLGLTSTCAPTVLAPGASATCTATHTTTQAQVEAGRVANTATATATTPASATVSDVSDEVAKTIAAAPGISVVLGQSAAQVTRAGDGVLYTYVVTNTGNLDLDDLQLSDARGVASACASTLAVGESVLCSATHVVTQAEVDGGVVANRATVAARATRGPAATGASARLEKTIDRTPALTTTVAASGAPSTAGDEITYTVTVQNSGNVTVSGVTVAATLGGTYVCDVTTLAPGAKATCTSTYEVTQAQVNAGTVVNTVTGAGATHSGAVGDPSDPVTTSITRAPELTGTLLDSGTPTRAGDEIAYTATVENTGNVSLGSIAVTDDLRATYTCDDAALHPGERTTCAATHAVTQTDVDRGVVENAAEVTGAGAGGVSATHGSNVVDTTITAAAKLSTALAGSGQPSKKGDEIAWTATVANSGNVTVTAAAVTDTLGNDYACDATKLAPGASATCVATDQVSQAEVNAGRVVATATGAAKDPKDARVSRASDEQTVTIAHGAALTATLRQSAARVTKKGQTIAYTYTVENTGNVTVDALTVTDALAATVTCDTDELAPGETASCTAPYEVTQADVDAAKVANRATAAGRTPAGAATRTDSNPVSTSIPAAPSVETAVEVSGTPTTKGDEITYMATVENTGNVTIDDVEASDTLGTTARCVPTTLAPGDKATCTATYEVTQADVDRGAVENTMTGGGRSPSGASATAPAPKATTPIPAAPSVETSAVATGTPQAAGDTIELTVTVRNTGNVTIAQPTVTDTLGHAYACDVARLLPGESATCIATHAVTQAEVDRGEVVTTVTGDGQDPAGDRTQDEAPRVVVTIAPAPRLVLTDASAGPLVDADRDGRDSAGDTVTYTYTVRNAGTVTLRDAEVTDTLGTDVDCVPSTVAPGASVACVSAPVPVTQAQVDAGRAATHGTATATPPSGPAIVSGASDPVVTPLRAAHALAVVTRIQSWTDVDEDGKLNRGDLVSYAFDVTNTGNLTVDGLGVRDERLTGQQIGIDVPTPVGRLGIPGTGAPLGGPTLAPGQSTTGTGVRGYVVTARDVQQRVIGNAATAEAVVRRTGAPSLVGSNQVTIATVASPRLTLTTDADVDDANDNGVTDRGDTIRYAYAVANTGDITLENVRVENERLADQGITITCMPTTLTPGESATCRTSAPYVVSAKDVRNGTIVDSAVAHGDDPVSATATDVTSEQVDVTVETEALEQDPPAAPLADTGGPTVAIGALGVLAVGLGAVMVGAARRRRVVA